MLCYAPSCRAWLSRSTPTECFSLNVPPFPPLCRRCRRRIDTLPARVLFVFGVFKRIRHQANTRHPEMEQDGHLQSASVRPFRRDSGRGEGVRGVPCCSSACIYTLYKNKRKPTQSRGSYNTTIFWAHVLQFYPWCIHTPDGCRVKRASSIE